MNRTLETVKQCCGEECQFKNYPIARIMVCGLEITEGEKKAAKVAYIRFHLSEKESWPQP
jgi:hypothetical protein